MRFKIRHYGFLVQEDGERSGQITSLKVQVKRKEQVYLY